ncbi:MAG: hypothetical protein KBF37_01050 [Saprospiraceae bacterium]|jgi:tellurite resistance protein|nr:hypothetical protein [Saprospiraceae bacterium]MBP9208882.1 hypothetical protein [Saprospiraceae bacterium]MBV6472066.1 hypothetical protein [Saprospiraceae bacterium]
MNYQFKDLSAEEYQQLVDAVPMIALLIAGADDHVDLKEHTWAEKIVKIRSYHNAFDLKAYYKDVDSQFSGLFERLIAEMPTDANVRCEELSRRLSGINAIMKKLPMRTSSQLYNSFLSYADQIARSSGGFLRMMAVSREEVAWVGLPMIDPIFFDELEDEEEE